MPSDLPVTESEIRGQLARILESPIFRRAEQLRRFLSFAVEETLAGKRGPLKEYVIGVHVFSRGESFDPKLDPIVRVQARTLRLKLDEYYSTEGKNDEVIIALPKRSYEPVFSRQPAGGAAPAMPASPRLARRLAPMLLVTGLLLAVLSFAMVLYVRGRPNRREPRPAGTLRQLTFDSGLTTDPALSRDGRYLAYASDRAEAGNLDLWLQQIGSAEPRRLTSGPGNEREPDFSADGTALAFSSDGENQGVYLVRLDGGGSITRLTTAGHDPHFSPDGRWITYWTGERHVYGDRDRRQYVIASAGGPPREIVTLCSTSFGNWINRGRELLVYGLPCNSNERGWYRVPSGISPGVRTVEAKLVSSMEKVQMPFGAAEGQLTSAGDDVVFASRRGDATDLWLLDRRASPEGSLRQLTFGTGMALAPAVAGRKIAFVSGSIDSDIFSIAADANSGIVSGPLRRVVSSAAREWAPSVAGGSGNFTFLSMKSGAAAVWIRDRKSGTDRMLSNSATAMSPRSSRDGRMIAYQHSDGGKAEVRVEDARTGRIIAVRAAPGSPVDWSGNGREVLINSSSFRGAALQLWNFENGRNATIVEPSEYGGVWNGSLSPDFRWLAFHSMGQGRRSVYVAPFRGFSPIPRSEWITVSDGLSESCPRWSPDGRLLYFLSDRDGSRCIWAQRLDSGKRPDGRSFPVYHFHDPSLSISNLENPGTAGLSVTTGELILAAGHRKGNIWMLELPEKP